MLIARSNLLLGKVLCMETLSRLPAYHEMGVPIYLDPDTCVWDEQRTRDMYYVSILRLFFVRGQPTPEIIGTVEIPVGASYRG